MKPKPWKITYSGDEKRCYVGPIELDFDDVDHKSVKSLAKKLSQLPVLLPDMFGDEEYRWSSSE